MMLLPEGTDHLPVPGFVQRKAIVFSSGKCHPPSPYNPRGLSTLPEDKTGFSKSLSAMHAAAICTLLLKWIFPNAFALASD